MVKGRNKVEISPVQINVSKHQKASLLIIKSAICHYECDSALLINPFKVSTSRFLSPELDHTPHWSSSTLVFQAHSSVSVQTENSGISRVNASLQSCASFRSRRNQMADALSRCLMGNPQIYTAELQKLRIFLNLGSGCSHEHAVLLQRTRIAP